MIARPSLLLVDVVEAADFKAVSTPAEVAVCCSTGRARHRPPHCRPRDLVAAIDRCPEIEGTTAGEDIGLVEAALFTVQLAWIGLGLIDRDDRLTDVGAWVLPRALTRAWGVDFDDSAAGA